MKRAFIVVFNIIFLGGCNSVESNGITECTNIKHDSSPKVYRTFCRNSDSTMLYWDYNIKGCSNSDYKVYYIKGKVFTESFSCVGDQNALNEGVLKGIDKFGDPILIREGIHLSNGQLGFYKNNKKDGLWITFGNDSNVIVKEEWENGALLSRSEYTLSSGKK